MGRDDLFPDSLCSRRNGPIARGRKTKYNQSCLSKLERTMGTENYKSTPSSFFARPSASRSAKWGVLTSPPAKWGKFVVFRMFFIGLLSVTSNTGFSTCLSPSCALIYIYAHHVETVFGELYETSTVRILPTWRLSLLALRRLILYVFFSAAGISILANFSFRPSQFSAL